MPAQQFLNPVDLVICSTAEDDCHQKGKKKPEPTGHVTHVVDCGGEDGVDRIAFCSGEVVPLQMTVVLHVAGDCSTEIQKANPG